MAPDVMGTPGSQGQEKPTAETLGEKVQQAASEAREAAGQAGAAAQQKGQDLGRQAQQAMGQLRDSASEFLERGRESVQSMGQTLESQIRQQPLPSLLIAAGVGMLLGVFMSRK